MSYDLTQLSGPEERPAIITIVAEAGLGKSSLGATMPAPVFIRTEDGLTAQEHSHVTAFPMAASSDQVLEQIQALCDQEHNFKTLVMDSVTALNTLVEKEIVANDPKQPQGINQALGGYGNGHAATSERHRLIREWAGYLSTTKGMNVVFIAHADSETIDPPDSDSYTRYSIRINKKSIAHYVDNVDLVGFIKLQTFVSGGDKDAGVRAKATTSGARIITAYPTPNHISKNRFGITADIPYDHGVNPFTPYVPFLQKES